jgi:hypothetical protein
MPESEEQAGDVGFLQDLALEGGFPVGNIQKLQFQIGSTISRRLRVIVNLL